MKRIAALALTLVLVAFLFVYGGFSMAADEESLTEMVIDGEWNNEKGLSLVFNEDGTGSVKTDNSTIAFNWTIENDTFTISVVNEEKTETIVAPTSNPNAVSYSTNDKSTVKNGNSGVYAYKSKGGTYSNYYVIDFVEGYVYSFREGNGDGTCDRLKIESGDLNSVLIITYHDGEDTWSYGLYFNWKNQPDHLILEDNNHFTYDYYTTNLNDALNIRDSKTMVDY